MSFKKLFIFSIITLSFNSFALPIDWNGVLGVDSTLIDNFRKIEQKTTTATGIGSQEPSLAAGQHANASFQTYVFRLNPVIVVNDATSIKGEVTTGYGRGGRLGDSDARKKGNGFGNALYNFNTNDGNSNVIFTKMYGELYADTATFLIGRHTAHWGLGTVVHSGDRMWDRHPYIRDGVTLKFKLGNFQVEPFFAKIGSSNSLTRATKVKEWGTSVLYDNFERDFAVGLYYSKKENGAFNSTITADTDGDGTQTALGKTDVKLTDIYFRKGFGDLDLAVEFPILSGEIGRTFTTGDAKYKAKALIGEASYALSDSWKLFLNLGQVSGDAGSPASFEAMYLNPNYQIANLMFRYNMMAVADTTQNVFDSYITNARFAKLAVSYKTEKWTFMPAFIWAVADETAKAGQQSFNHLKNKSFIASANQSDDLGFEVDFDIDYKWNNEVVLGASTGFHFVGDYYAFNNTATANTAENSYVLQFRCGINF